MVYHVINRGVGKQQLFFGDEDYRAFHRVIVETLEKRPMRLLSHCLMPNHWHFVLWPEDEGDKGDGSLLLTTSCSILAAQQEHCLQANWGTLPFLRYAFRVFFNHQQQ